MTPAEMAAEFAAAEASHRVAQVVKKGALQVKNKARATVAGSHSNAGKIAAGRHINFDMIGNDEAEIGYDKGGAGNFGHFNEYGSAKWAPDRALSKALESEAPVVAKYIEGLVDRIWR